MFPPKLAALRRGLFWVILIGGCLSAPGCDMRGCICHEALTIDRSVKEIGEEEKQFKLGNPQTSGQAEISMKVPAAMNASLCVC